MAASVAVDVGELHGADDGLVSGIDDVVRSSHEGFPAQNRSKLRRSSQSVTVEEYDASSIRAMLA